MKDPVENSIVFKSKKLFKEGEERKQEEDNDEETEYQTASIVPGTYERFNDKVRLEDEEVTGDIEMGHRRMKRSFVQGNDAN